MRPRVPPRLAQDRCSTEACAGQVFHRGLRRTGVPQPVPQSWSACLGASTGLETTAPRSRAARPSGSGNAQYWNHFPKDAPRQYPKLTGSRDWGSGVERIGHDGRFRVPSGSGSPTPPRRPIPPIDLVEARRQRRADEQVIVSPAGRHTPPQQLPGPGEDLVGTGRQLMTIDPRDVGAVVDVILTSADT